MLASKITLSSCCEQTMTEKSAPKNWNFSMHFKYMLNSWCFFFNSDDFYVRFPLIRFLCHWSNISSSLYLIFSLRFSTVHLTHAINPSLPKESSHVETAKLKYRPWYFIFCEAISTKQLQTNHQGLQTSCTLQRRFRQLRCNTRIRCSFPSPVLDDLLVLFHSPSLKSGNG